MKQQGIQQKVTDQATGIAGVLACRESPGGEIHRLDFIQMAGEDACDLKWSEFVSRGLTVPQRGDDDQCESHVLSPEDELSLLAEQIGVCRKCDLADWRTQAVPGEGNMRATIMFVGEAPGAAEDQSGRPFVGASGKFLDSMLRDIGLARADVFFANVNRCRPPGNRDPLQWEIDACHPWLRAQLRIIQPKVICPLGRFALGALLDAKLQISKVHGQPIEQAGILYVPLYHPAAALHRQDLRDTLIADMHQLRSLLQERGLWES